jgi:flagellar hook protein FlgE
MPLTSLYTALTGLNNNAMSINVIGNNLANLNTTAFKSSKVTFAELLGGASSTSSSGNPIQVGLGSSITGIPPNFNQGSIAYTGRTTDAAISGNGFFVISTGSGQGYSRAGSFSFNSAGELINSEGFNVLGYSATNGAINYNTPLAPIVIQKGSPFPPKATTELSISANLSSSADVGSANSTAVQIYDSLGQSHTVTISFTRGSTTGYAWSATIPAVETGGAATDSPVEIGTGSLTFNGTGQLVAPTANPDLAITGLANGAADMTINFGILDKDGNPRFTGYASDFNVSATSQNGSPTSVLRDISIDASGIINGISDSGQVQPMAQLALANFANVEGLLKFQGSTFSAVESSGEPSIGIPGSAGRGTISGASLEQSNVDIAQEFVNLIIAQRGYQANSRIITTTDELYQDSLSIKR